ncbi:glycine zipper 2TM domain-containing protein [Limnohabitans sp. DCL3]|uniref:glycine zipper 2TM domain-containing protein n=1 Tax=Limnohabitans sp. DCL3 TaxID=3374103 RepID=UPI003A8A4246
MKTWVTTSALLLSAWGAQAQEVGQVISRTAVYQQVAVPRQTCTQSPAVAPAQNSGGGAIIGAITGGLIGSQLGGRDSKGITAMAGVIGGAILGDKAETQSNTTQPTTTCTTQNVYENRLVGYNVVYEYAGKQYNVQLPQDPGPTIPVQVTPLSAPRSEAPVQTHDSSAPSVAEAATVITESRVVYVPTPVYRSYPPSYTHISLGWSAGHRPLQTYNPGFRHGGWR